MAKRRADALAIARSAIGAVRPDEAVRTAISLQGSILRVGYERLDLGGFDRIFVLGAGKAAGRMASALEEALGGRIAGGLISTGQGYGAGLKSLEIVEAGHPVPDARSMETAKKAVNLAAPLGIRDLVFCLISGGASAMWAMPAGRVRLADKIASTELLLKSGAEIREINVVRKHLSGIKGGLLARAIHPAKHVTLVVSDVVGDDISAVGSGPTAPDPTTYDDALSILRKYGMAKRFPLRPLDHLRAGAAGRIEETPKPGDRAFDDATWHIIASNRAALDAAARAAERLGYKAVIITDKLTGGAADAGRELGRLALEAAGGRGSYGLPAAILAGGETTVAVQGTGKGGRNQELVLSAAIEIAGSEGIAVASVGTDGIDGPTDAAGAIADGLTMERGEAAGLPAERYLLNNDSYNYFDRLGDLIRTGPTGTNVMDIQIVLIGGM